MNFILKSYVYAAVHTHTRTPLPYNGQILLHLPCDNAPWEAAGLFLAYTSQCKTEPEEEIPGSKSIKDIP